jgi:hypothetical protein
MGQHNNQKGTIGAKERKKRNKNQKVYFLFLLRRGHPSQPRKDDGAQCCGEGAFSGKDTTIKSMLPWLIFHFHL